ncbi:MAG: hypothetical protein IPM82_24270 [Saprospiraceae bacterium]|nr:hypothetical protein [Saprospiraceae bacterium]
MTTNEIIMLLCGLILFPYLFEIFAKRTKVPAVLLLLATGIGLRLLADALSFPDVEFSRLLPLLGTVGLILIVLEGALDLHFNLEKKKVIIKTLGASFFFAPLFDLTIGWLFPIVPSMFPFQKKTASSFKFSAA